MATIIEMVMLTRRLHARLGGDDAHGRGAGDPPRAPSPCASASDWSSRPEQRTRRRQIEAATAFALRVAGAVDRAPHDAGEGRVLARDRLPIGKAQADLPARARQPLVNEAQGFASAATSNRCCCAAVPAGAAEFDLGKAAAASSAWTCCVRWRANGGGRALRVRLAAARGHDPVYDRSVDLIAQAIAGGSGRR